MADKTGNDSTLDKKDWAAVKERERPEDQMDDSNVGNDDQVNDSNKENDLDHGPMSDLAIANQQLQEKVDEYKEIMIRAKAEVENMRKRTQAEVQRARSFGLESIVKALLPIIDSMQQGLSNADEASKAGIQMTHDMLKKVLKDFGVEEKGAVGEAFDAAVHEAMSVQPSDEVPSNHIVQVLRPGFSLNGRVVRAAMVIVAK